MPCRARRSLGALVSSARPQKRPPRKRKEEKKGLPIGGRSAVSEQKAAKSDKLARAYRFLPAAARRPCGRERVHECRAFNGQRPVSPRAAAALWASGDRSFSFRCTTMAPA